MRGPRVWQALVAIFLTIMVTLNLRILMSNGSTDEGAASLDSVKDLPSKALCEKPMIVNIKAKADVIPLNKSFAQLKWLSLKEGQAKMIGLRRDKPGFLTIGVPSIKRINGMTYLVQTLTSLVDKTSTQDKMSVVVVVFLGDMDTKYNAEVIATLSEKFMDYINAGFIQIIQVSKEFYPALTGLKRNFKDKPDRVTWRAKQVVDFAFMFLYSRNLSQYYVQIEDDIMCADNFVSAIREYVKAQSTVQWAVLEFSVLGFIGKLFKSEDLPKLARYMLTFYDEQPVDWLITYFRLSMAQRKIYVRKPTLFQHVGLKSSFDISKDNKLKDKFFDSGEKPWKSDDPPGVVVTNMKSYEQWLPSLAYGSGSGYFWATDVKLGNWLAVVFDNDVVMQRLVVETGHPKTRKDQLVNGTVEVSPKLLKLDEARSEVLCADSRKIGQFDSGRIDLLDLDTLLNHKPTKCVKIIIGVGQENWVVFHQIAVFVVR